MHTTRKEAEAVDIHGPARVTIVEIRGARVVLKIEPLPPKVEYPELTEEAEKS